MLFPRQEERVSLSGLVARPKQHVVFRSCRGHVGRRWALCWAYVGPHWALVGRKTAVAH